MTTDVVTFVIDDDEAVRDSLVFLLQAAGISARAYSSPLDFLQVAGPGMPGCVVTDIRMPEMSGLELLKALRTKDCQLPVIVITGHGDVPLAVAAMKEGARDFFEKPFDDEALLSAVREAIAAPPFPLAASAGEGEGAPVRARLALLSMRERQVLDGLVKGLPNKTIAYDLGISARTVEIYRSKVMIKMGAASFAELVRLTVLAGAYEADPNLP